MSTQLGEIKVFTLVELSKTFDISLVSLRRYIKDKKIFAKKIGNTYYVTEENLNKFLNSTN